MTAPTPLDAAHAAMQAAPDDSQPRMRFYEALAAAELVLLLEAEPAPGAAPRPALFDTGEGRLALAFDSEERLAAFTGAAAAYAALPGRALAAMLAGQGIGLGLNLSVAPSEFLMDAAAVDWLAATVAAAPAVREDRPEELTPPDVPEALVSALDRRLARAEGLADHALLAGARWPDGSTGTLLAVVDAAPGAEEALSQAIGEALTFAGVEGTAVDIAFLPSGGPLAGRLLRHALRFDLPKTPTPGRQAPGMDPDRPPKLR